MNDDFLKRFRKSPRGEFARQLHEQLVQKEREKFMRTNHTHKEKQDMTTIAIPQSYYPPRTGGGHLVAWLAAVLAIAFAFILMIGYTANRSIFTGLFQDAQERQRDVIQVYINQVWNSGDTARLDSLLTEDHVTTTTIFGTVEGVEGVANLIAVYRTAMPDFIYSIDQIDAEEGTVWVRGTITGTHTGTFTLPDGTEIPPTGNIVTIDSVIRFTFEDGKISAIHQVDSTQDLMEQFGAAQSVEEVARAARNIRVGILDAQYSYSPDTPDLSHTGEPTTFITEYYVFRSGAYDVNIPYGDGVLAFENPDYTSMDPSELPGNPGRRPVWDSFLNRNFAIISVSGNAEAVAVAFRVDATMGGNKWGWSGRRQVNIPTGDPVSFEMIQIYRLNEDGTVSELWWYLDNREYAAADYGFSD